jgi:hypothetical protein
MVKDSKEVTGKQTSRRERSLDLGGWIVLNWTEEIWV